MGKHSGRPTKLTPELQKEICTYIENGSSFIDACTLCNISEGIFYEWKKHGREAIEKGISNRYSDFLESLKKAEAKFKVYHIQRITLAAKSSQHWTASAWILERKYNSEFGRKDSMNIKGNFAVGNFDIKLTPEEEEEYKKRVADIYGDIEGE